MIRSRRSRLATLASWSRHVPIKTLLCGPCPLLLSTIRKQCLRPSQTLMVCDFFGVPSSSITSWLGAPSSQEAVGTHKRASLLSQDDSKTSSTKNLPPNTPAYTATLDTAPRVAEQSCMTRHRNEEAISVCLCQHQPAVLRGHTLDPSVC